MDESSCDYKAPNENNPEIFHTVDVSGEGESVHLGSFERTRLDQHEKISWTSHADSTLRIEDIQSVSQLFNFNETIQLYNVIGTYDNCSDRIIKRE